MFAFAGRVVFVAFFVQTALSLTAQNIETTLDYGLSFASHEVTKDQRTSLNLTPDEPIFIQESFQLKFDIAYQRLTNAFGYILRIIANDSLNIDLVSSPEHAEFNDLNLIINNSPIQLHYDFAEIALKEKVWNKVIIEISHKTNQVIVSWNGNRKAVDFPVAKLKEYRFVFGANGLGRFNTSDVPPISLRNIEIASKPFNARWELKEHGSNSVYDTQLAHLALATNPIWLIDRHVNWLHRKEFSIGRFPSATFDNATGTLYVTDDSAVHVLDMKSGKLESLPTTKGSIAHTDANQLLYVRELGTLFNYDVESNKLSRYDSAHRSWSNSDTTYNEPRYWHNNKFYNPFDQAFYTFGGYGYYAYSNEFRRFDPTTQSWQAVATTGSIAPRYLAALGLTRTNDKALIFGGYGSKSGKQEMSPHSFYDLYSFDLRSHELKDLWTEDVSPSSPNIVFSNSLVINESDSCFYVLSYPKDKYESQLKLRSYSLTRPSRTELGDSIPFLFHDVHSFSDLFSSDATKELVAVTAHKEGNGYKIEVYSINYPPLRADETLQALPSDQSLAATVLFAAGLGTVVIVAAGAAVVRRKRRRMRANQEVAAPDAYPSVQEHAADTNTWDEEKKSSVIDLFGGFQVIDKSGIDITHKFTATLKDLFIFILLHSVKLEKGVSTAELHEFLWPDKDEVSARNNRNVNLKKLRKLLEEIGDIAIENTNSYVHLSLPDSVFCDYQTAYRILNSAKIDRHKVEILIRYVRRGSLLPNMQAIWLDSFKSEISNNIIDVLLAYSSELDMMRDDKMLLDIADSIFNYDTINQEAMVLKCSVLNKKGKHSLAKNWYDHFAKEYMNLYGENYPKTFEEVVS
ncbi:MAG TPA: hypothetical protein VK658_16220 [Chryseolinea sp.]|nr:hypothetical protein [Chryseolinea sp.]